MVALNIFHVLVAIAMVALILVQRGAGATAGAAFGSGASGTVFGARGAGTFLTKSTWVLAAFFCAISLTIAVIVSRADVSPATDLGVIAATQPVQQEGAAVPATEAAPEAAAETAPQPAPQTAPQAAPQALGGEQADVPTMMTNESAADGAESTSEPAAQDLPGIEEPVQESTEINQGQDAAGTDSDDS